MKNKGFTLIEILAVMVILTIILSIAIISVSRYRGRVDEKDLQNLHSIISTAYENYRTDEAVKGNIIENVTVSKTNDVRTNPFLEYLTGISYSGEKINTNYLVLEITLHRKGDVLSNRATNGYNQYVSERTSTTKIKKGNNTVNATTEDIYVIDSTCEVTHEKTDDERDLKQDYINKTCKYNNGVIVPSTSDLVCIKATYKDNVILNDLDKNATGFNKLCNFVS